MTKAPTPTDKSKKQRDNTKTPPTMSIAQRLRTDVGPSVGLTTATQLGVVNTQSFLCVQKEDMSYLRHVRRVFERLGYTVIESDWLTEWDVAWSWNYPFWGEIDLQFYDMKPHQKVGIRKSNIMFEKGDYLDEYTILSTDQINSMRISENDPSSVILSQKSFVKYYNLKPKYSYGPQPCTRPVFYR